MNFSFDPRFIRTACAGIDHRARVAFGLLCCERLYPNYLVFKESYGWGEPKAIREALDAVWDWLEGAASDLCRIAQHGTDVAQAAPDTELFDSSYVSFALDAATSTQALLEVVIEDRVEGILEIAACARDTIDLYIRDVEDPDPSDPSFEEHIRHHPLMQRELSRQRADFELLERHGASLDQVARLRSRRNPASSNIDLIL